MSLLGPGLPINSRNLWRLLPSNTSTSCWARTRRLSRRCSESLCKQTNVARCLPRGIHLLTGAGIGCTAPCNQMKEFGCKSSSSAVLSHVRAGSVQEHAWLSCLTSEVPSSTQMQRSSGEEGAEAGCIHSNSRGQTSSWLLGSGQA